MRRTARMTDHGTDVGPVSSWAVRRAMCCGSTPNVVRTFICPTKEYHMKKVAEMYGDSPEEARRSIARSGAARAAYYKTVSGRLWGDLHGYELCIDAAMGEGAAGLICDYMDRTGRRLFCPPASYPLDGKNRGSFRWKDPRFFTLTEVGEKRPRQPPQ